MAWKETINLIIKRKENKINGIPTKFKSLKNVLPAWDHRESVLIFGGTGSGKTNFAVKHAILDSLEYLRKNPQIDAKFYYFSLELSRHEVYIKLFVSELSNRFNKSYHRNTLLNTNEGNVLTDEELDFLKTDCKEKFDYIDTKLVVIDIANTPNKMMVYLCNQITQSQVDNPDFYNLIIVDTTNAISADSGESQMQALKKWNQQYALKVFRNEMNATIINVQQQDKASSTRQFSFKGESVEEKYIPTLESLGGDKEAANSANLVLSIFDPGKFNIKSFKGYNVPGFYGGFRVIYVNKNNFGADKLEIPYYFNGATNDWIEIEEDPDAFKKNKELYFKYVDKKYIEEMST